MTVSSIYSYRFQLPIGAFNPTIYENFDRRSPLVWYIRDSYNKKERTMLEIICLTVLFFSFFLHDFDDSDFVLNIKDDKIRICSSWLFILSVWMKYYTSCEYGLLQFETYMTVSVMKHAKLTRRLGEIDTESRNVISIVSISVKWDLLRIPRDIDSSEPSISPQGRQKQIVQHGWSSWWEGPGPSRHRR